MQFLTNQVRLRNRLHCTTGPQPADIFGGKMIVTGFVPNN